jgi:hypothetical protein
MTTSKTIYDFSKQDVCMCMCVAKRKLCVFCSFVQNNNKKSIECFCGFFEKWQSFFEQNQVACVLPFLCGFFKKKKSF